MSNTDGLKEPDAADILLAQRQAVYGDRVDNMRRTAMMWSGFLGFDIKPWQVPIMMSLYKTYRLGVTPDYSDNIDDIDGWNKMFRELMGDELIQARTVEEYLDKKYPQVKEPGMLPEPEPEPAMDPAEFYAAIGLQSSILPEAAGMTHMLQMTSAEIMQQTDELRAELGELSPSEDEAFRDRLHDAQFPEDAPDTASSEGRKIDAFLSRRAARRAQKESEAEVPRYYHRYHRLNNESINE